MSLDLQMKAVARGCVVTPITKASEYGFSGQLGHEQAGQPSQGAEHRSAGPRCAGTRFVVIASGDNSDSEPKLKGIMQQPLEGAPTGMDFNGCLKRSVVGGGEVCVAPAAMSDDQGIFTISGERGKEFGRGAAIRCKIGMIGHECMGRAPDGAVFAHEINIAVAAERGVAGPLISGHGYELLRNIEA